jgi:hypothetical protein
LKYGEFTTAAELELQYSATGKNADTLPPREFDEDLKAALAVLLAPPCI